MLKFKEYVKAATIDEAYELNQKRNNVIIGGMLWLKMQDRTVGTAIDLSGLSLDTIEETEEGFQIGAMTTLRQLETNERLKECFGNAIKDSLKHIVGVQFRNLATVGGSVFGRYGFSDVLTLMMALDAKVCLHSAGVIPIEEFATMKADRDMLTHVIIPYTTGKAEYQSIRNSQTDFPVLTCCVAKTDNGIRTAIGARPGRAVLVTDIDNVVTEDNNRGSAKYRTKMAKVLSRRCLLALEKGGETDAG